MKILLTGAAGFIGFHTASRLVREGMTVVGIDNFNSYYAPSLKEARLALLQKSSRFSCVRGDLSAPMTMAETLAQGPFDAVIHFAAQAGVRHSLTHPESYVQSNLVAFANVLEACRRHEVRHLIFASSSSVYGLNSTYPLTASQGADHPASFYAATKRANELMAHSYSHLYKLPATGLRFFTVYGPWGRPDMAYFKFSEAICAGRPIEMFHGGELWRDFTYIDDVVESVFRLIGRPPQPDPLWSGAAARPDTSSAPYRIYNIGNHQPVKLSDFIAQLEILLDRRAVIKPTPMQPGDVLCTFADISELQRDIGFTPSTTLEAGLTEFCAWFRSYHGL